MSDIKQVLVPDVGGDEVEIIELCVAVGDIVEAEDALVSVETDKASMDIPAPFAGKITEIKVAVGDKINEGDLVVMIEAAGADAPVAEVEAPAAPVAAPVVEAAPAPVVAEAAVAAPAASAVIEVVVPDIGEDGEVDVIEVLVAAGDVIEAEDGLITLETDKATMDVPSPEGGTVVEVKVVAGDKVKQGSLVIMLETSAGAAAPAPVAAPEPVKESTVVAPAAPAAPKAAPVPHHPSAGTKQSQGHIYASPSIRRIGREFGVDLT